MKRNPLRAARTTSTLARIFACLALVACCTGAGALPIVMSESEFYAATAGSGAVVEDFQDFAFGNHPSPLTLANGVFSVGSGPASIDAGNLRCQKSLPDKCLYASQSIMAARTFSALPAGTNFWGADLIYSNPADAFDITVEGGSGTLSLSQAASSSFFGFFDELGLMSVSFTNRGDGGQRGQYSFDNVTTAAARNVASPPTLVLLTIALMGVATVRRHGRRASETTGVQ